MSSKIYTQQNRFSISFANPFFLENHCSCRSDVLCSSFLWNFLFCCGFDSPPEETKNKRDIPRVGFLSWDWDRSHIEAGQQIEKFDSNDWLCAGCGWHTETLDKRRGRESSEDSKESKRQIDMQPLRDRVSRWWWWWWNTSFLQERPTHNIIARQLIIFLLNVWPKDLNEWRCESLISTRGQYLNSSFSDTYLVDVTFCWHLPFTYIYLYVYISDIIPR